VSVPRQDAREEHIQPHTRTCPVSTGSAETCLCFAANIRLSRRAYDERACGGSCWERAEAVGHLQSGVRGLTALRLLRW
jgi:hypothetical protein